MRTLTQIRRRQSLTSQLVARLLFVYKAEFPGPDECIRQVQEAVEQECTKLKAGLHAYQALFETVCETHNEEDSDTLDRESYAA
jgi:alanyl-tRNA synthetase